MKKSKAETAETRQRIVTTAATEFRRKGIHATGLSDLMNAAGLTHGGFYRHFGSKDQLVAEACADGMASVNAATEKVACRSGNKGGLKAVTANYLSVEHRDDLSGGCLLAALGSELARADDETRDAVSAGIVSLIDILAKEFPDCQPEEAKSQAIFMLSAMAGAVTLSRIVTDPKLSASILRHTQNQLTDLG